MDKLTREDLVSLEQYAQQRDQLRKDVMQHKRNRRLELGTNATLYFEDRLTMLKQLVGIENHVWMQVGDLDLIRPIADEDLERSDEDKTSAVHFLRFELSSEQVSALRAGATLAAGLDHENYRVEVRPVAENVQASLLADLD